MDGFGDDGFGFARQSVQQDQTEDDGFILPASDNADSHAAAYGYGYENTGDFSAPYESAQTGFLEEADVAEVSAYDEVCGQTGFGDRMFDFEFEIRCPKNFLKTSASCWPITIIFINSV